MTKRAGNAQQSAPPPAARRLPPLLTALTCSDALAGGGHGGPHRRLPLLRSRPQPAGVAATTTPAGHAGDRPAAYTIHEPLVAALARSPAHWTRRHPHLIQTRRIDG
jgi:hypothetical protein